jgi:hypothetical protein
MPSLKGKYGELLVYSLSLAKNFSHSMKVNLMQNVNCTACGLIEYEEVSIGQLATCQFSHLIEKLKIFIKKKFLAQEVSLYKFINPCTSLIMRTARRMNLCAT